MSINPPLALGLTSAVVGAGLAVGGVFLLAGTGWAMLAAAVPLLGLAVVTFRGLMRVQ